MYRYGCDGDHAGCKHFSNAKPRTPTIQFRPKRGECLDLLWVFFLEIIAFGTCVNVYFTDWEGTGHDKRRQGFMGVPLDWKVAPNISEYLANLQLRHKTERRWVELRYKGSSSVYLTTDTPKSAASCSSSRADVVTLSIGSCQNWRRCAACASATSRATGAFSGASKPPAIQSENLIHTRG